MAGRAVREAVTLAGRAERARLARAFVEGVLGAGHPCGDVAALLVGELFSNSLRHSGSGAPGETVTVAVKTAGDVIRVEVRENRDISFTLLFDPEHNLEERVFKEQFLS